MVSPEDVFSDVDPRSPTTVEHTQQKTPQKGTSPPQQTTQKQDTEGKQPLGRGVPPASTAQDTHTNPSSSSSIIDHT